jgi:hypothetical protein
MAHDRRTSGAKRAAGALAFVLGLIAAGPAAMLHAEPAAVAYEDPAAAGRPEGAIAILTWGAEINVVSIDGSAPDPAASERRARLAPGGHAIYYFATVRASSDCESPRTGDDLAEIELEQGRSYRISALGGEGCAIATEVREVDGEARLWGPAPELWPADRLARVRELAAKRLQDELLHLTRAASRGDLDAAVDLALWYLLGDEPLPAVDPVAAQAWLLSAEARGAARAEPLRLRLEPTLTAEERSAATRLAARSLGRIAPAGAGMLVALMMAGCTAFLAATADAPSDFRPLEPGVMRFAVESVLSTARKDVRFL